jgi:hypothetical protein
MDRAFKILAALFATAAVLLLVCLALVAFWGVAPNFAQLQAQPRKAALIGLGLGYGTMFLMIYAMSARLIWHRRQWKKVILLAAASCFGVPVGPVLGIATLVLLTRPGVKESFGN